MFAEHADGFFFVFFFSVVPLRWRESAAIFFPPRE